MKSLLLAFLLFTSLLSHAQTAKRIRPGTRYRPGDTINAPGYGLTTTIPPNWEGVLPREGETFLLMPMEPIDAAIYVWGTHDDTIDQLKKRWQTGMDMGSGIKLQAAGPLTSRSDAWFTEGKLSGSTATQGRKIYAEAKCSKFGVCITILMQTNLTSYEKSKSALIKFVDQIKLGAPRTASIYEGFDWKEFLTDKVVMTYVSNEGERKLNEVHLCKDGSFISNIKRKGLFKNEAKEYQGKKKGTWTVGTGQEAVLTLTFEKAPPAVINLRIEDEKVFANGQRHFVGASDQCKP